MSFQDLGMFIRTGNGASVQAPAKVDASPSTAMWEQATMERLRRRARRRPPSRLASARDVGEVARIVQERLSALDAAFDGTASSQGAGDGCRPLERQYHALEGTVESCDQPQDSSDMQPRQMTPIQSASGASTKAQRVQAVRALLDAKARREGTAAPKVGDEVSREPSARQPDAHGCAAEGVLDGECDGECAAGSSVVRSVGSGCHAASLHGIAAAPSATHECMIPVGKVKVVPEDGTKDIQIGISLRCGAVHELCGLCGSDTNGESVEAAYREQSASRDDCTEAGAEAEVEAEVEAEDIAARRVLASMAPVGCVMRMLQSWASGCSGMDDRHEGCVRDACDSDGGSAACGSMAARALVERGILWIGCRVHPDAQALWRMDAGGLVAARSIYLRDDGHVLSSSIMRTLHGGACNSVKTGGRDAACRRSMAQRVWCAEQALRLGAGGVIVIDGDHFDTLAWRRLHLAAQSASQAASLGDDGSLDAATAGGAPGPIVLVLTSPHASGGLRPRGCAAETRWTVHPAFDIAWNRGPLGRVGTASASGGSNCWHARARAPAWRMRLVSVRSLDSVVTASEPSRSAKRAWLEQGRLECLVRSHEAVEALHPSYRIASATIPASMRVLKERSQSSFMRSDLALDFACDSAFDSGFGEAETLAQCLASKELRSVRSALSA